ncbi:HNH endonuclease [Paenibacillus tyrfis]|uniref:HNH domain-containing protein n=1 Tax=Paenibacillus tyrfis TaxID=1501230 RepID=A0A081NVP5_9BACL|nr:hypothetical protein [Paenibacillus tyrfis]KEQ22518.1 hypothetical protein ET33_22790 [Paenibacillus tyrfis]
MYKVTENINFLSPYHNFMCKILKAMRMTLRTNHNFTINELKSNILSINPDVRGFINRGDFIDNIYKLKNCPIDLCKEYGKFVSRYKSVLNGKWKGKSKLTDETSKEFKAIFIFLYENLLGYKTFNIALFQTTSSLDDFRAVMSLNQVCPYCDITKVNKDIVSVDHFLPKAAYPILSIFPDNLIVACKACNEVIKGEKIYLPIAHPYYEEISNLFTFIIRENDTDRFEIEFAMNQENSRLTTQKVVNFLKLFEIEERYEKYMTAELQDFRAEVRKRAISELNGIAQTRSITNADIKHCTLKHFSEAVIDNRNLKRAVDGSKIKNDYINQIIAKNEFQKDIEYIETHFFGFASMIDN